MISEVRNGRMLLETSWRREDGMASKGAGGGMVRCYYSVDLVRGERDKLVKDRGGDGRRQDGGRDKRGANVLYLLGKVGNKVISSEAGRRWRGGMDEEGREHGKQFPGV